MFRLTRLFLWNTKDFCNCQSIYRPATSYRKFAESVDAKTKVIENNVETYEKAETTKVDFIKSREQKNFQNQFDKILNPLELSKLVSDEEALHLSKSMTPEKVIEVMKFLTTTKSRPIKLLKALVGKICECKENLNVKQCADIMYCLGIFSFKNVALLDKLANDIKANHEQFVSGILPASILQSCGILKYRNTELMDILLQKILLPGNPKRNKCLLSALITLATVNYFPPFGKAILSELSNCSLQDYSQTKLFLDFVWACVILHNFSKEQISTVLSENFYNQIQVAEGYFGHSEPIIMKLLNIQAAANLFLPSYDGPKLPNLLCRNTPSRTKTQFLESVIDGLSHIFPKNGYLNFNINTNAGFVLDVECYMDSAGNPIPLRDGKKQKKIGIMLLTFNDFCLGDEKIECGLVAFKEKVLRAMGYKIVKIDQTEYNSNVKLYEKVHYLRKNLEAAYKI